MTQNFHNVTKIKYPYVLGVSQNTIKDFETLEMIYPLNLKYYKFYFLLRSVIQNYEPLNLKVLKFRI